MTVEKEIESLVKSIRNAEEALVLLHDRYCEIVRPCNDTSCDGYDQSARLGCHYFDLVTECPDYDYTWVNKE